MTTLSSQNFTSVILWFYHNEYKFLAVKTALLVLSEINTSWPPIRFFSHKVCKDHKWRIDVGRWSKTNAKPASKLLRITTVIGFLLVGGLSSIPFNRSGIEVMQCAFCSRFWVGWAVFTLSECLPTPINIICHLLSPSIGVHYFPVFRAVATSLWLLKSSREPNNLSPQPEFWKSLKILKFQRSAVSKSQWIIAS